ncbi:dihydroorotate dehydrogenase [Eubacteriales bacterium OttesenSCG-928-A19]|nr:dihydroorotate dehydrogenase [Eubacteriales bacterium OttesenSCG-928-A19]
MSLSVRLGNLTLPNPIIPASGTFGFGYEMAAFYDLNRLGGIALKGTTEEARFGNETPRIAECREGMLNAIGLQNPGVDAVIARELPRLRETYQGVAIANISGFSVEEYVRVAMAFDRADGIDLLEINVSCPNVQHGGMAFGVTPEGAASVCRAVKAACRKPVYMKLSPNVTDIAEIAAACEDAGADGLSMINTLLGMVIDPRTGKPVVSTRMAGFSGPAVKPVALRMVYQVYERVRIPIIGIGGMATADDVLEMLSAGASAVQVGAQNLVDPWACARILDELPEKMDAYGISDLQSIIGRAHT